MTLSLDASIAARAHLVDPEHLGAFRLLHGFTEGDAARTLDVYGRTLVLHDHGEHPDRASAEALVDEVFARLPWLRVAVWKARRATEAIARNGVVLRGEASALDARVREDGVWYATALTLNRDAGLYLDTRLLRAWLRATMADRSVLNTFAYTGSLGIAAMAAPARRVVQLDRNGRFLDVARRSYALNGWPVARGALVAADFFAATARMRREGALFDCVVVDPPFFSATASGTVDLVGDATRCLDKTRSLVADGGCLVAVNNALFLSGAAWRAALDNLGDGYVSFERTLDVPADCGGGAPGPWPADPSPFHHPTKIAVLRVRRKDGRRAG